MVLHEKNQKYIFHVHNRIDKEAHCADIYNIVNLLFLEILCSKVVSQMEKKISLKFVNLDTHWYS